VSEKAKEPVCRSWNPTRKECAWEKGNPGKRCRFTHPATGVVQAVEVADEKNENEEEEQTYKLWMFTHAQREKRAKKQMNVIPQKIWNTIGQQASNKISENLWVIDGAATISLQRSIFQKRTYIYHGNVHYD
jgi:hypothetical protein